jgi:hypothetical protein
MSNYPGAHPDGMYVSSETGALRCPAHAAVERKAAKWLAEFVPVAGTDMSLAEDAA